MKALTEQQIKTINDFEDYKKTLRTKYYEMQKSMQMLQETIEEPSEKAKVLISTVKACCNSLEEVGKHIVISKENVLNIDELGNELTPIDDNQKKNKVIRWLLEAQTSFSFATGRLLNFVKDKDDFQTLNREKNVLESHIEKVIEIILDQ